MTESKTIHTPLDAAFFDGLRALMAACGPKANKHDLAIVVITACIEAGVDERSRIIGVMKQLGFDRRHTILMLKDGLGVDPESHRWHLLPDGVYRLH